MIDKIASNLSIPFHVRRSQDAESFSIASTVESSIQKTRNATYQNLVEQSVLQKSLLYPLVSESATISRMLVDRSVVENQNAPSFQADHSSSIKSYFSGSTVTQNKSGLFDTLPPFEGEASYFFYGAPKPEVYYFVPEKLWQAVVMTPGIEKAAQSFEGVPALFELPRWEVETGVGKEPKFRRVEVNDRVMLSYDYPQVLTYAADALRQGGAGSGELQILESLKENIRQVLNEPLSLSSRPSEAYYAARILVLFGVEELYAAYDKSVEDYVKWAKATMKSDEQMRIFSVPQDLKREYEGVMKDPQYEPLLTKTLEDRVRDRTTNYNYPKRQSSDIRKVTGRFPAEGNVKQPEVHTAVEHPYTEGKTDDMPGQTKQKENHEQVPDGIPDRPLTSREKLLFYGSFDSDQIQRSTLQPPGS